MASDALALMAGAIDAVVSGDRAGLAVLAAADAVTGLAAWTFDAGGLAALVAAALPAGDFAAVAVDFGARRLGSRLG